MRGTLPCTALPYLIRRLMAASCYSRRLLHLPCRTSIPRWTRGRLGTMLNLRRNSRRDEDASRCYRDGVHRPTAAAATASTLQNPLTLLLPLPLTVSLPLPLLLPPPYKTHCHCCRHYPFQCHCHYHCPYRYNCGCNCYCHCCCQCH